MAHETTDQSACGGGKIARGTIIIALPALPLAIQPQIQTLCFAEKQNL
jgi:hypothetical protein